MMPGMVASMLGVHESSPSVIRWRDAPWSREFISDDGRPLAEKTTSTDLISRIGRRGAPIQQALTAGGSVALSIKLPLDSVLRGRWKPRLEALGRHFSGNPSRRFRIIINHEPENDAKPGVFVPAFNAAREALKAGAPNLPVDYAGMAYAWRPGAKETKNARAWAADLLADRYGIDVYFGKSFDQIESLATHPGLARWLDEMVLSHPGRGWYLAEYGRMAHQLRPAMFAKDFQLLAEHPVISTCEGVLAWNTGGTEKNPGWILDPASEQVIREGFAMLRASTPPPAPWPTNSPGAGLSMASVDLSKLPPAGAWSAPLQVRRVSTDHGSTIEFREPQ